MTMATAHVDADATLALSGQTVVVIGGSSGIGLETARPTSLPWPST
jgi:NADPH:quinone reductase-like Zn-dependent oxidoreductase